MSKKNDDDYSSKSERENKRDTQRGRRGTVTKEKIYDAEERGVLVILSPFAAHACAWYVRVVRVGLAVKKQRIQHESKEGERTRENPRRSRKCDALAM